MPETASGAAPERVPGPDLEALRADLARADAALVGGRLNEADGIALDVLARAPGLPGALAVRAYAAAGRDEVERATFLLEAATARRPVASWLVLLSTMYRQRFRLDDALRAARLAVARSSAAARLEPLLELARTQIERDEPDGAADCFLAAIALDPENARAHLGLGQILLGRGDFGPGWIEYEWRNRLPEAEGRVPPIKAATWNGMALPRGRLLLVCDQGFGDAIQFARYLPQAANRVYEIVLACSPELQGLFARIPGVARCCHRWTDVPGFAAHALLSSLPSILETRAETIPASVPYLAADPACVLSMGERLRSIAGSRRTVGIVWSGRPTHPNNTRRSLDLSRFAPILNRLDGDCVVSLQKQRSEADAAALRQAGVHDLAGELATFDETAGVLSHLDLLVTVDSAVAHLAGALGRPVWVLLPAPADWRWQRGRDDSPWYPTMRLFRQPAPGEWAPAISALASSL